MKYRLTSRGSVHEEHASIRADASDGAGDTFTEITGGLSHAKTLAHQGIQTAAPLIGAAVGITTFAAKITQKYPDPFKSKDKTYVVLNYLSALGVPKDVIKMIAPANLKDQYFVPFTINPFGFLNNEVYTGAGMLILDYLIKAFGGAKFGWNWVSPIVKAIGGGLLTGGTVGGFLDDPQTEPGLSRNPIMPLQGVNTTGLRLEAII